MDIAGFTTSEVEYVPTWGGNRDRWADVLDGKLEESQIFIVELLPLTKNESDALDRAGGVLPQGQKINVVTLTQTQQHRIIKQRVKRVRGLRITLPNEPPLVPTTGAELLRVLGEHVDAESADLLLNELIGALRDRSNLERGQLDLLRSQSVSG